MAYAFRFPGFRVKALTFSYDDGVEQDIRLVNILQKNGLSGTFNINSGLFGFAGRHRRLTEEEVRSLYARAGIEVAGHTLTHPETHKQTREEAWSQIVDDQKRLAEMFSTPVIGFAYPFGGYNDILVDILRENGFLYARTVESTGSFALPADPLRLPATCHHNSAHLTALGDAFLALQDGKDESTPLALFYVWGHSYEFEDKDNWQVMEDFAAKMAGKDDIWYATNGEIFTYLAATKAAEIGNGKCHNPTSETLYLYHDKKPITVAPGETVTLR